MIKMPYTECAKYGTELTFSMSFGCRRCVRRARRACNLIQSLFELQIRHIAIDIQC